jgi:hypothetical protein
MEKLFKLFANVISGTALVIVILTLGCFVGAFPLKWAWNCAMPEIFHLTEIGFWEAFSLIWIAGALVKASASTK